MEPCENDSTVNTNNSICMLCNRVAVENTVQCELCVVHKYCFERKNIPIIGYRIICCNASFIDMDDSIMKQYMTRELSRPQLKLILKKKGRAITGRNTCIKHKEKLINILKDEKLFQKYIWKSFFFF